MKRLGEVYKDDKGEWRWTIYARNGKILADSNEGYRNKAHCIRICKSFGVSDVIVQGSK